MDVFGERERMHGPHAFFPPVVTFYPRAARGGCTCSGARAIAQIVGFNIPRGGAKNMKYCSIAWSEIAEIAEEQKSCYAEISVVEERIRA